MPTDLPNSRLGVVDLALQNTQSDVGTLQTDLGNVTTFVEGDTNAHEIIIPLGKGVPSDDGSLNPTWVWGDTAGFALAILNSGRLAIPINDLIFDGMVISNIRARVDPGGVSATSPNTMRLELSYFTYDANLDTPTETVLASVQAANSSGGIQTIADTVAAHVVAKTNRDYIVRVTASNTATGSNDKLSGIGLTVANPAVP